MLNTPMSPRHTLLLTALALLCPGIQATTLGTNTQARPLPASLEEGVAPDQRAVWTAYLRRSELLMAADKAAFGAELASQGKAEAAPAPKGRNAGLPLRKDATWYASAEALSLAANVISFQTPSGGWSKNVDMTKAPRQPGQHYTGDNSAPVKIEPGDFDPPRADNWAYIGTFDNGATVAQLQFLAKCATALDADKGSRVRAAYLKGFDYVLGAQMPNGGFPQVFPLMGGYHDAVTFNDDAMVGILELLRDIAEGREPHAWLGAEQRAKAAAALQRGIDCVLACQIRKGDTLSVWSPQHDAITLAPCAGRNYEMPCECSSESAELTLFLMSRPAPSEGIVRAVNAAEAWFRRTKLDADQVVQLGGKKPPEGEERWARFYELGTHRPIFGDRDRSIHDTLTEISRERQKGYGWFGGWGNRVLQHYPRWSKTHGSPAP